MYSHTHRYIYKDIEVVIRSNVSIDLFMFMPVFISKYYVYLTVDVYHFAHTDSQKHTSPHTHMITITITFFLLNL